MSRMSERRQSRADGRGWGPGGADLARLPLGAAAEQPRSFGLSLPCSVWLDSLLENTDSIDYVIMITTTIIM